MRSSSSSFSNHDITREPTRMQGAATISSQQIAISARIAAKNQLYKAQDILQFHIFPKVSDLYSAERSINKNKWSNNTISKGNLLTLMPSWEVSLLSPSMHPSTSQADKNNAWRMIMAVDPKHCVRSGFEHTALRGHQEANSISACRVTSGRITTTSGPILLSDWEPLINRELLKCVTSISSCLLKMTCASRSLEPPYRTSYAPRFDVEFVMVKRLSPLPSVTVSNVFFAHCNKFGFNRTSHTVVVYVVQFLRPT